MLAAKQSSKISQLFKVMGDPFRVRLLLALAEQEACVCHLERLLGRRQAFISQHLMSLREAGVLSPQGRQICLLQIQRPRSAGFDSAGGGDSRFCWYQGKR